VWPDRYEDRLVQWRQLRSNNLDNPLNQALMTINDWWLQAPLVHRYIRWNDWDNWPSPWELLADNHFCNLARALGIMYTIEIMQRSDITHTSLAVSGNSGDNLVLVNKGKYILNWAFGELLNITSNHVDIKSSVESQVVTKKIY